MKKFKTVLISTILICIVMYCMAIGFTGCGQIGAPTGGMKDTIPPRLARAIPENRSTDFKGNKITLQFDEYINLEDVQNNVLISPYQSRTPQITFNFRTVTIKFRDTLSPNTTYTINFGNAIRDLNENNPLSNFTYIFSTGPTLDSLTLSGKVMQAENGDVDSSMIVSLYTDLSDSAVKTIKPKYISRLKGDGHFTFENLPPSTYNVFALKDGDNSRTYNSKTESIGFLDKPVVLNQNIPGIELFTSATEKSSSNSNTKTPVEKKFSYSTNLVNKRLDILQPLKISFNHPLKNFEKNQFLITDSSFRPVTDLSLNIDTNSIIVSAFSKWNPGSKYNLIIQNTLTDTLNNSLAKTDTLKFSTFTKESYGRVVLRFTNINFERNPILQLLQGDKIIIAAPLTGNEWKNNLVLPGEYDIRILYDNNKNGIWDPGSYELKKQPEKAVLLKIKLTVKADWDNEIDIRL